MILSFSLVKVQAAVANCLPPLMPALAGQGEAELVDKLMNTLLEGSEYGQRRGAAFGIAGVVKGLGILRKQSRTRRTNDIAKVRIEILLFDWHIINFRLGHTLDYRCIGGRFPVTASCVTISNPHLLSSSEAGVDSGMRSC